MIGSLSPAEAYLRVCDSVGDRLESYNSCIVVVEGRTGVGKSTFQTQLEATSFNGNTSRISHIDELPYKSPLNIDSFSGESYDLVRGVYPRSLNSQTCVLTTNGAAWLREKFSNDGRFVWVLVDCDLRTRFANNVFRPISDTDTLNGTLFERMKEIASRIRFDVFDRRPDEYLSIYHGYEPTVIIDNSIGKRLSFSALGLK